MAYKFSICPVSFCFSHSYLQQDSMCSDGVAGLSIYIYCHRVLTTERVQ